MKVVRAQVLGFCMGVRRAVDLACAELERSAGKVYTLGPLIHNPQVLEELSRRGIETLDECLLNQNLHGASVIIRAHGVNPQTEKDLRGRGTALIDATCPRVKASQLKAETLARAGYYIFLAGEENHAEIIGIRGYADSAAAEEAKSAPCAVVGSASEARTAAAGLYRENPGARTALIGQTTISAEEYTAIGGAIAQFYPKLEIAQTICAATKERQDSLRELMDKVDAIIVAGGEESANTWRLFAIAHTSGKPCALVQTAPEIPPDFFRFNIVGLAAGASTPDTVIDSIEQALLEEGSAN